MEKAELKKRIAEGVARAHNEKKKCGKYVGSLVSYGYIRNPQNVGYIMIDKNCSHVVYLIFDLYDKGLSHSRIADYLNERNIVNPTYYRKNGKYIDFNEAGELRKWQKSSIRKILINKIYNGKYKDSDEKTHKEIIDDELWKRVQEKLHNYRNNSKRDLYSNNGNEFNGKVYCKVCGKHFNLEHSLSKGNYLDYLKCGSYSLRNKTENKCTNKYAIRYEELKDIVSMFIEEKIFKNIDCNLISEKYYAFIKNKSLEFKRKNIIQEKNTIKMLLKQVENSDYVHGAKIFNVICKKYYDNLKKVLNFRLEELEKLQNELLSYSRTKIVSNKEKYIDINLINEFIDRIEFGILANSNRDITIYLK